MLNTEASLKAISIEGPLAGDPIPESATLIAHEIDVAEYYGGSTAESATEILYVQLKHSTVRVDSPWTPSELKSTVVRFARHFANVSKLSRNPYAYRFVSNRPVSSPLRRAVIELSRGQIGSADATATARKLRAFAGLGDGDVADFFSRIRFDDDESGLARLSAEVSADLQEFLPGPNPDALLRLKEAVATRATSLNRTPLHRADILAALKATESDLFPAPSSPDPIANVVSRPVWSEIATAVRQDHAVHVIHATGGVGKTTFAQMLPRMLGVDDESLFYDCFDSGAYRQLSKSRHAPRQAFVQIANELAARHLCAPLVPDSTSMPDQYARALAVRLEAAAKVVAARSPGALLVLIVDAADNAVMASSADVGSVPFVGVLVREELPANVRLILTTRTERLDTLDLPLTAKRHPLPGFDERESAENLAGHFTELLQADVAEFHARTFGNPRVQAAALRDTSRGINSVLQGLSASPRDSAGALESLFQRRFDSVLDASQSERSSLVRVLQALAALRPRIPIKTLAELCELSEHAVRSFVSDLAGPFLIDGDYLQFRDEPTETFVRSQYLPKGADLQALLNRMRPYASSSIYLASALPQLLWEEGEVDELIELALSDVALPLTNEVERQEANRNRLSFALRAALHEGLAKEAGVLAIRCGAVGASNSRVNVLLSAHADLAGQLLDPETLQSLAAHGRGPKDSIAAALSREGCMLAHHPDSIGAGRSRLRSAFEWMVAWSRLPKKQRERDEVTDSDIANVAYGWLVTDGAAACIDFIERWKPADVHYRVARKVFARVLDRADGATLETLVEESLENVHILLAYSREAMSKHMPLNAAAASQLIRSLDAEKDAVEIASDWSNEFSVSAAVAWAAASSIRADRTTASAAGLVLDKYLSPQPPRSLSSPHGGRRDEQLFAYGLREHLSGNPITEQTFAGDELRAELLKEHSSSSDREEYRSNIVPLVRWIDAWVRSAVGDEVDVDFLLSSLPAKVTDYKTPYLLTNIAPKIAARLIRAQPSPAAAARFLEWYETSSHVWRASVSESIRILSDQDAQLDGLTISLATRVSEKIYADRSSDVESRSDELAELARAVLAASPEEAAAHFANAVELTERVGDDLRNLWEATLAVARQTASASTLRPQHAFSLARMAEDVDPLIEISHEMTVDVLGQMHLPSALAIGSRWRDRRFASIYSVVSGLVSSMNGWHRGRFSDAEIALSYLSGSAPPASALRGALVNRTNMEARSSAVGAVLSAYDHLGANPGDALRSISTEHGFDIRTVPPHELDSGIGHTSHNWGGSVSDWEKKRRKKRRKALRRVRAVDLATQDGLRTARRLLRHVDSGDAFAKVVLGQSRGTLPASLRAMSELHDFDEFDLAPVFKALAALEHASPGVRAARATLASKATERLAADMVGRSYERVSMNDLAICMEVSASETMTRVLAAASSTIDFNNAETAYAVLQHLAVALSPDNAVTVLESICKSVHYLTDESAAERMWSTRLEPPADASVAIGHFLWACMGDPDGETRWKAAHCVRSLLQLGAIPELEGLADAACNGIGSSFTDERLPFYEMHAMQWLLMAAERELAGTDQLPKAMSPILDHAKRRFPTHALIARSVQRMTNDGAMFVRKSVELEQHKRPDRDYAGMHVSKTPFRFDSDFVHYWLEPLSHCFPIRVLDLEKRCSAQIRDGFQHRGKGRAEDDPRHLLKIFGDGEKTYLYKYSDPQVHDLDFYLSYHAMMVQAGRGRASYIRSRAPTWTTSIYGLCARALLAEMVDGYPMRVPRGQSLSSTNGSAMNPVGVGGSNARPSCPLPPADRG